MSTSNDMSFIEVEESHRGYLTEMLTGDEFSERILGNIDVSARSVLSTIPASVELLGTVPVELPNVNSHVHIVLGIGFYVNFVLAAYFYVQGIRHSRCCRCGRYVPVRRYNIGRILTGQMPLCPDCKLIVGVDFVVIRERTRK